MTIQTEAPKTDRMAAARAAKAAKQAEAKQVTAAGIPTYSEAEIVAMSAEDKREYRRRLLDALTDVPNPDADNPTADQIPGTLIGEGPVKDKVAFTERWFLDVEARKKDISPDYAVIWFDCLSDATVRINGVAFQVFAGRRCGLPAPHYQVYMDNLRAPQRFREKYAAPKDKPTEAGSMVMPHRMNDDGFFHTAEEAAAIDKQRS